MAKKQVLKISSPHSDEIIKMTASNSIYVDNNFYKQKMKERLDDPDCSSFPVRVTALRMGWILKSEDGIDGHYFLSEILKNEDLNFYNIQSLRMIIEFLYNKIKKVIFLMLLPPFLTNIILFCTVAILNEDLRNYYEIDRE